MTLILIFNHLLMYSFVVYSDTSVLSLWAMSLGSLITREADYSGSFVAKASLAFHTAVIHQRPISHLHEGNQTQMKLIISLIWGSNGVQLKLVRFCLGSHNCGKIPCKASFL